MANGLKLEGQRFGHLTVLKKLDERENRYVVWLCRCDCGNEIKVNTRHLMRGTVKDCGCIPENSSRRGPVAEDLTGRRFGKLVAVKKLESKNGRTRWECRCDCGNFGVFVAVDDKYSALIPAREATGKYRPGAILDLRVTEVKEDGKMNVSDRQKAYIQINEDAESVLSVIEEFAGVLPFDDHASPEVIKREFGLSKNAFKRAVGHLMKEGKVEIRDKRIYIKK